MPQNATAFYDWAEPARKGDSAGGRGELAKAIEISPDYFEAITHWFAQWQKPTQPDRSSLLRMNELQKQFLITDRAETLGNWAMQSASARDWPKAIEQMREG